MPAESEQQPLRDKNTSGQAKASVGEGTIKEKVQRRSFISWLAVAWVAFAAATGGFLTMILRIFFPNVLFEPPQSFKIGPPEEYEIGLVDIRWQAQFADICTLMSMNGLYTLSYPGRMW